MRIPPLASRFALSAAAAAMILAGSARADDAGAPLAPTFSKDVAPILYSKCLECHRPGEIAPMSLISYTDARPWAKSIRQQVADRKMPPWHADSAKAGPYQNDTSLSETEIASILKWVDSGAPEGDAKDLPKPPEFKAGWKLGQPDVVFAMPEPYTLSAEGEADNYRCFVLPAAEDDYWVRGFEVHPGNRAINHHVALFLDGDGKQSVMRDEHDPGVGYGCYGSPGFQPMDIFGVWAPGMTPELLPEGIARPVPKGSRVVLQLHYHRNGKIETDKSEVGLYFAKAPVKQKLNLGIALDFGIMIPPGKDNYVSKALWTLPKNAQILSVFPHMHVLGKTIGIDAILPDGKTQTLVSVPRYQFDWQRNYFFKNPVSLPAGTKLQVTAVYDNTETNPANPNKPPKPVRFGMSTTDEMNIGFITFTYDDEDRIASKAEFPRDSTIVMDMDTMSGARDKIHSQASKLGI